MMMLMVMTHLFVAGLPRHRSGGRLLGDRRANGDSNKNYFFNCAGDRVFE